MGKTIQNDRIEIGNTKGKDPVWRKGIYMFGLKNIQRKIFYRLLNYHKNLELLKQVPHILYEDFAVVYFILEKKENDVMSPVFIDRKKMEDWDLTGELLEQYARENTPAVFPAKIQAMSGFAGHTPEDEPAFLLTNEQQFYGAGVILYEGVLDRFARQYECNLYLLPTSIHEFVILFDRRQFLQEELLKIVQESNNNLISEDDFLSDNVYYYDKDDRQFFSLF